LALVNFDVAAVEGLYRYYVRHQHSSTEIADCLAGRNAYQFKFTSEPAVLRMSGFSLGGDQIQLSYICENYICNLPTADPQVVARLLDGANLAPNK
jgi:hypothetical protein